MLGMGGGGTNTGGALPMKGGMDIPGMGGWKTGGMGGNPTPTLNTGGPGMGIGGGIIPGMGIGGGAMEYTAMGFAKAGGGGGAGPGGPVAGAGALTAGSCSGPSPLAARIFSCFSAYAFQEASVNP